MSRAERAVVADPAADAAARLVRAAEAGGHIVLTGGSTPRKAYERAASADWSRATVWFSDERCVDPDDPRSNFGIVREALLERTARPPAVVHRIEGELGPAEAADRCEQALTDAGRPAFSFALLGLGSDGHVASLFPGRPEVDERERWAVGVPEAGLEPFVPRVSLTLPALNGAREVVFLVAGADKANAVRRAFGPDPDVPGGFVSPGGPLTLVLDPAAAG
jgi:6-phosphogluconolactonase